MVFENITALELHLHTGEGDPTDAIDSPDPDVSPSKGSESGIDRKVLLVAMLVVSVVLSIAVTLIARKVGGLVESRD